MYENLCSITILEIKSGSMLFCLFFQVKMPFATLRIENIDKIMISQKQFLIQFGPATLILIVSIFFLF